MARHIAIVAGELSGDLHASQLVTALRRQDPTLVVWGLGGQRMAQAGVQLLDDLVAHAVVGLTAVLRKLPTFQRLFRVILSQLATRRPDALILVDYPGFNLRLARAAKRLGIPVIYYIAPQVWAWGLGRLAAMRRDLALVLVAFDFEEPFFRQAGIPAEFVGHPLLDQLPSPLGPAEARQRLGLPDRLTLGLLPGSRAAEVRTHLPLLVSTVERLAQRVPHLQGVIPQVDQVPPSLYTTPLRRATVPIHLRPADYYTAIQASDCCLVASGTATLETALLARPLVVLYRTSWLTYAMGRTLVRIPYLGMVNVISGREVAPEFIQHRAQPASLAAAVERLLASPEARSIMLRELEHVRPHLGAPGASGRAAQRILEFLNQPR